MRVEAVVLSSVLLAFASMRADPGVLVVANQVEHTAVLVDLASGSAMATIAVGVNGHELAVSPDGQFAYVPIYGNSGVGRAGTDGGTIDIINLRQRKLVSTFQLPKPVRPHAAKFGRDGLLYVTAELAKAVYAIDVRGPKVIAEIPTGQIESHMLVLSPDGKHAYTANVGAGSVSVLDLEKRALVTVIPVAQRVQRISISPDGHRVFTHDQTSPRIAIIDTQSNAISGWIEIPATVYSSATLADNRTLLASSPSGKLFFIDLHTRKVVGTLDVPRANGELLVTRDGRRAYLSCPQAGVIEVNDPETQTLEAPNRLSRGVDGLDWLAKL